MILYAASLAATMALCFLAWGFFYIELHRRGIDYTKHFLLTTIYFLFVAVLVSVLFWRFFQPFFSDFSLTPLMVVFLFMAGQTCAYFYVPRWLRNPTEYFNRYPDRYYLKIDWRRLISKSADIFAQQIFIVVLVSLLSEMGLPILQLCAAFFVLFALLHVPLIANEYPAWPSWVFAGAVAVFSIIFPPLILFVSYGFVYTFLLHWLFYTVLALWFWVDWQKRTH